MSSLSQNFNCRKTKWTAQTPEIIAKIRFHWRYKVKKVNYNFKLLFEIFYTFFKISPITFGGGFAMIPVLETEMVEKKKWVEKEKIVDIFAVAQSVPGAIAVNAATFLGYQLAGIPGALVAALGMIIPTFVIIIILGTLLVSFQHNVFVKAALAGIRPVIVALIATAAFKMGRVALSDRVSRAIAVVCIITLLVFKSINLIFIIISGAIIGVSLTIITDRIKTAKAIEADEKDNKVKTGDRL